MSAPAGRVLTLPTARRTDAHLQAHPSSFRPISDYAVIGDCASAALIASDGSIDWLCWPRFDSPSLFAALLDPSRGGRCVVRPSSAFLSSRHYLRDSNVLKTTFRTSSGVLELTDAMIVPLDSNADCLRPDHEILRSFACVEGTVEVELLCEPRFDYGRTVAACARRGALGWAFQSGRSLLTVRSTARLEPTPEGGALGRRLRLRAGETQQLSLLFDIAGPAALPPLGGPATERLRQTIHYWRDWSSHCTYAGRWRDLVLSSALALKLLTFAKSGAVVAAPTTSLPESLGGVRNWDYRYVWIRDASFIVRALVDLGYVAEGSAFIDWLLHSTRSTAPGLKVLYSVYGAHELHERTLPQLRGYRDSRPVRIGNAAVEQLQLDIYGTLIAAAHDFVRKGHALGPAEKRLLGRIARAVLKRWRCPDQGIWELRSGARHQTLSIALCWVALARTVALVQLGQLDLQTEPLERAQAEMREMIERDGYNSELESYTTFFADSRVDASLLLLPIFGYVAADAPRMNNTCRRIREELGRGSLVLRYDERFPDGIQQPEGAFLACSFWLIECLALAGELDEAEALFERVVRQANDVGLFSEEIDPDDGTALGNFPQGLTHMSLINAALRLEAARQERDRSGERVVTRTGDVS